jgi:hypothetical protein
MDTIKEGAKGDGPEDADGNDVSTPISLIGQSINSDPPTDLPEPAILDGDAAPQQTRPSGKKEKF